MDTGSVITGFALGIVGSFIGAWFSYFFSERRRKKESFERAAVEFRHAFDDILFNIEEGVHPVHELLRNFFRPHKVAMWHFEYYLIGKTRDCFDHTRKTYQAFYDKNYDKNSVLAQFSSTKTDEEVKKLTELRQHVEALLKYTV